MSKGKSTETALHEVLANEIQELDRHTIKIVALSSRNSRVQKALVMWESYGKANLDKAELVDCKFLPTKLKNKRLVLKKKTGN